MQIYRKDTTDRHHADTGAGCGKSLSHDVSQAYGGWDKIDIAENIAGQVGLLLRVTRHLIYASNCPFGHVTRASHYVAPDDPLWDKVELGQWRLIGPRLAGAIVFLAPGACRVPASVNLMREILNLRPEVARKDFLSDFFAELSRRMSRLP